MQQRIGVYIYIYIFVFNIYKAIKKFYCQVIEDTAKSVVKDLVSIPQEEQKEDYVLKLMLNILGQVNPGSRVDTLQNICVKLESVSLKRPLPPKENSIAANKSNKLNQSLITALKEVKTSNEFLETTETAEMNEIAK